MYGLLCTYLKRVYQTAPVIVASFSMTACDLFGYLDYDRSFIQDYLNEDRVKDLNDNISKRSDRDACFMYPGKDISEIIGNTDGNRYFDDLIILTYIDKKNIRHIEWIHKSYLSFEQRDPLENFCDNRLSQFAIEGLGNRKYILRKKEK